MIRLSDSAERINHPCQKIEGNTIIVDPKGRLMHQLNDVGSRVWELLKQNQMVQDIVSTVINEYEVAPSAANDDIIQLLEKLSELKLIKVTHNE